ncbi:MAG: JAB domain-containing protein [Amphritea sp.]
MYKQNSHENTCLVRDSEGVYHRVHQLELLSVAQNCIKEKFKNGEELTSPERAGHYFQVLIGGYEHEVFTVAWLNNRHEVIGYSELFRGTLSAANVYPREVVKEGLARNAAAVILAHNHPSGVAEPSHADVQITERIKAALELVDIRVLDHMVIGSSITSMAERGLL